MFSRITKYIIIRVVGKSFELVVRDRFMKFKIDIFSENVNNTAVHNIFNILNIFPSIT